MARRLVAQAEVQQQAAEAMERARPLLKRKRKKRRKRKLPKVPSPRSFQRGHGFRFRSSLSGARVFIAFVIPSAPVARVPVRIRRCGLGLRLRSSSSPVMPRHVFPQCKLCTRTSCSHRCSFGELVAGAPVLCNDQCLWTRQCRSSPRSSTFLSWCAVQVAFIGVSMRWSVLSRVRVIAGPAGSSLHGRGPQLKLTSGGCRVYLAAQLSTSARLPLTRTVLWLWRSLPYSVCLCWFRQWILAAVSDTGCSSRVSHGGFWRSAHVFNLRWTRILLALLTLFT